MRFILLMVTDIHKGNIGMANQSSGFWSSLQGILTGLAAVITALTGLYLAVKEDVVSTVPAALPPAPIVTEATPAKPVSDKVNAFPITALREENKQPVKYSISKDVVNALSLREVDCAAFPTKNTARSLMSWSNYYQQQVIDAEGNKARAITPCIKTIGYRAQAYCLDTTNTTIEASLKNTLAHCGKAGVSWRDAVTPE